MEQGSLATHTEGDAVDEEALQYLLKKNVDLEAADQRGATVEYLFHVQPLLFALKLKLPTATQLLIDAGANVAHVGRFLHKARWLWFKSVRTGRERRGRCTPSQGCEGAGILIAAITFSIWPNHCQNYKKLVNLLG